MPETDESLLQSFAATRDGTAFRLLAERYLGLIFHTALRRTGNRQLAQEVSQSVLCALARKAGSLAGHPERLPAWLHRAAVFESTKTMRSESSHQRRKRLLHPDQIDATGEPAAPWNDAIPHLDAALDKLPEADRMVLLLHYFEDHSFPHIAGALGKSRAAVEKQSQRALQKLSRLLRAKGVALPATAIAAGLSTEAAKSAPLHLLASAVPAALAAPAASLTHPLLLLMKSKAAIPLVLLVCVTPLALQQRAISRLHHENERLRGLASATGETSPRPNRPHAATAALPAGLSSNLDIYVLLEESDRSSLSGMDEQFQAKLNALPPETLVRLVKESANLRAHSDRKHALFAQLLTALERTSPELALNTAIDAADGPESFIRLSEAARIGELLSRWTAADPDAALAWFLAQSQTPKFQSTSNHSHSLSSAGHLAPYLLSALVSADHPGATAILSGKSERDRHSLITDAMRRFRSFSKSPDDQASNQRTLAHYLSLLREQDFPRALQEQAWGELSHGLFLSTFSEVTAFFQLAGATPEETQAIATSYLRPKLSSALPFDPDQERRIESEVAAFLEDLLPDQADAIFAEIAGQAVKKRADHARQILDLLKTQPSITDQHLSEQLIRHDLRTHTEEALELASRIQDPGLRQSTIETLRSR